MGGRLNEVEGEEQSDVGQMKGRRLLQWVSRSARGGIWSWINAWINQLRVQTAICRGYVDASGICEAWVVGGDGLGWAGYLKFKYLAPLFWREMG